MIIVNLLRAVMVENIEKVLDRGEKIELLVDKTDPKYKAAMKVQKPQARLAKIYALAAGKALIDLDLSAEDIARKAMGIAAEICVYTNGNLTVESL